MPGAFESAPIEHFATETGASLPHLLVLSSRQAESAFILPNSHPTINRNLVVAPWRPITSTLRICLAEVENSAFFGSSLGTLAALRLV